MNEENKTKLEKRTSRAKKVQQVEIKRQQRPEVKNEKMSIKSCMMTKRERELEKSYNQFHENI